MSSMRLVDRAPRMRSGGAAIALLAALLCSGLAVTRAWAQGAELCIHCVSINDTSSSGGDVVMPRYIKYRAFRPPVAFVASDSTVRCAVPSSAGWVIETVDATPGGRGCSIELDDFHEPLIAYHDRNGMLFWARRLGAGWLHNPIDPTSVVLGSTSLARVPAGLAITYLDAAAGILHYAEQDPGGQWHVENVAQVAAAEAYPSLLVDGDARAISYYDLAHHDLRLAQRQTGGAWNTQVIDATADVGGYSSLVGQPSLGTLGVAYYDFAGGHLRYALGSGGGWTVEIVDNDGNVGRFCSAFAFVGSPQDRVGIAYYDGEHGDLKYALRQGGAWMISRLDTTGNVGRKASCGGTSAPDDTLGVAYVQSDSGTLKYLRRTNNVTAVPAPVASRHPLHVTWARSRDGSGTIRFDVRDAGAVRVSVHDAQGRLLAVPFAQELPSGAAEIRWDGHDRRGVAIPSGVYLIRVQTAGVSAATSAAILR